MNVIANLEGLKAVGKVAPNTIINADCLEVMKLMPDNCIDLILCDPPYYRVKKEKWDRQWDTAKDFLDWLDLIAEQWQRILKPNGSLYCFASPRMAARVEVKLGERFNVLNNIRWEKKENSSRRHKAQIVEKSLARSFYPDWESIIFCEHHGADNIAKSEAGYGAKCDELRGFIFEPLRAYLDGERRKAGASYKEINSALCTAINGSGRAGAYFSPGKIIHWDMPLEKHYTKLQQSFPNYFTRPYEELRLEYEDLRLEYEDLRRPFSVTAEVPYTDVWTYPTVSYYEGKHPCEKPIAMLEHIITASSREGTLVLDSFAGSASTAIAAINTNRRYICIEKDEHYFEVMRDRIEGHDPNAVKPKPKPKSKSRKETVSDEYVQLSLFDS